MVEAISSRARGLVALGALGATLLSGCRAPAPKCVPPNDAQLTEFLRLQSEGLAQYERNDTELAIATLEKARALNACDVSIHNDLGIALHQAGRSQKALEELKRGIELDPLYPLTHLNAGIVHEDLGDLEAAAQAFRAVIELSPDLPDGHRRLGLVAYKSGQHDLARAELEKTLELGQDSDVDLLLTVGNIAFHGKDFARSEEYFRRALALSPQHADANYKLAQSLQRLGRDADAKPYFEKFQVLSGHQEKIDGLERVLATNPERLETVHLALAREYEAMSRFEDALASYERAAAAKPDDLESQLGLARVLLALKRHERALQAALRARQLDPKSLPASDALMTIYADQNQIDSAIRVVEEVVATHPDYPEALLNLAILYQRAERYKDAIPTLERFLAKAPDNLFAHEVLLTIYTRARDASVRDVQRAVAQARRAEELGSRRYDDMAEAYHMSGNLARALELLRRGLAEPGADQELLDRHIKEIEGERDGAAPASAAP